MTLLARRCRALAALALFASGVALGVLLQYYRLPGRLLPRRAAAPPAAPAHHDLAGDDSLPRVEVPAARLKGKRVLVLLCAGQSNAANHGDERYTPRGAVYNFYLGRFYRA